MSGCRPLGCRPLPHHLPTDAEYRERHERREAEREVESWGAGHAYTYQAFNRKEWPPYSCQSGVPLKVKR